VTNQLTLSTPARMQRFNAYQIQFVVETIAADGIEKSYELFATLADAQKEVESFNRKGSLDGQQKQAILWSLYGLWNGIAEHLADRLSEAEAFGLLYAIGGISGISGQTHYPVPDLWTILHSHRHGTDVWIASAEVEPTGTQVVRCLGIDFEPDREECLEIHRVDKISSLDWQEGDECPLAEGELEQ
jgi:hypothetical protein